MYNEFFAIPLNIFGTCYTSQKNGELILSKVNQEKCVYPVGLDPSWIGTMNELTYTNSLKMKLSIIVGVLHMMLGIFIRGVNNMNSKNHTAFFFEFIPQFLFMGIMFGYLIAMIYYKWGTDYDNNTQNAPSLLSIMINMAIKFGEVDGEPLFQSFLGFPQESLNRLILFICVMLVPIMLFVKPIQFYLKKTKNKGVSFRKEEMSLINNENKNEDNININNNINNINNDFNLGNNSEDEMNLNNSGDYSLSLSQESKIRANELYSDLYQAQKKKYKEEAKSKFQFVELFIGQLIEVIEYVLGTVSNTASYLRLWALSLAHTALSHVFIEKTFIGYIQNDQVSIVSSVIGVFIYFMVFLLATGFILIFMDAMECVLHTLRLHWVEFQNKFYKGDGYLFEPFSFKTIFNGEEILKEK
jgi:V-type H+-transporting ATPase subunit a